jgi:hypothetical protein
VNFLEHLAKIAFRCLRIRIRNYNLIIYGCYICDEKTDKTTNSCFFKFSNKPVNLLGIIVIQKLLKYDAVFDRQEILKITFLCEIIMNNLEQL